MSRRGQANAAQQVVSNFGQERPARPTVDDIRENVPGARAVSFDRLPEATQRAIEELRAKGDDPYVDPKSSSSGTGGVIVLGLSTDPKEVGRQRPTVNEEKPTL